MTGDLNLVAAFLARRDVEVVVEKADVLLLTGNCLLDPIQAGARIMAERLAKYVIVSGGIGHSTSQLRANVRSHPKYRSIPTEDRAEADIVRDILRLHHGIDDARIVVENQSTNCGANAEMSKVLLERRGIHADTIVLIQDPTMQRRTHASCVRSWQGTSTKILSWAPFVPETDRDKDGTFTVTGKGGGIWPFDRFLSLIQGEIARLRDDERGYGPRGANFIDRVDIPRPVLEAHSRITAFFQTADRLS